MKSDILSSIISKIRSNGSDGLNIEEYLHMKHGIVEIYERKAYIDALEREGYILKLTDFTYELTQKGMDQYPLRFDLLSEKYSIPKIADPNPKTIAIIFNCIIGAATVIGTIIGAIALYLQFFR